MSARCLSSIIDKVDHEKEFASIMGENIIEIF